MKTQIRWIAFLAVCVATVLAVNGCPGEATVTVAPSSGSVEAGKTMALQASSTSSRDTSFQWSSGDDDVAIVDSAGLVTGVRPGETTVTARGRSSGASGTAAITVTRPPGALSELEIMVDPLLEPLVESLPPLEEGGEPRKLAVVVDERGHEAEFVENELILMTNNQAAVDAFVTRWQGEVLSTVDPAGSGLDFPKVHLIRIDTALGDPARLEEDILKIDPEARGSSRVSSEAGLRLIAASAKEAAAGLLVGMNFLTDPQSLASGSTQEAPTGPTGFSWLGPGYSDNAFDWHYLNGGSIQDIGVTEAWYLLANTEKLNATVRIAIIDMGFRTSGNADMPSGWFAVSDVPGLEPTDRESLRAGWPWHGTDVACAAFGIPDNGYGGAGPAGPVADPILIYSMGDYWSIIVTLPQAAALGADIVNLSTFLCIPAAISWNLWPSEVVTLAASQLMLLCTGAGSNHRNVDAEDCFLVCWEEAWCFPCENGGVLCVGGLDRNSTLRASASNWGPEQVEIFAPFVVLVGPHPGGGTRAVDSFGTSMSSGIVAGVAALVMAANPDLSVSEVRDLILDTAHISPDPQVKKYVNAELAVATALPATIVIQIPSNGLAVHAGLPVTFRAFLHEGNRGPATVTWTSSLNGEIGTGLTFDFGGLAIGTHTITARATFENASFVEDTATLHVVNSAPEVLITSPVEGTTYLQGQPVLLSATSTDVNEPGGHLSDPQMSWFVDGAFIGNNHSRTIPAGTLSLGPHSIRVEGNDGELTGSATVGITVEENPPDRPPDQVNITNPLPGADLGPFIQNDSGGWFVALELQGNAHDPEDGDLTGDSLVWNVRVNNGAFTQVGTGTGVPYKQYIGEGVTTFAFRLTAIDSAGNSSSATSQTEVTIIF